MTVTILSATIAALAGCLAYTAKKRLDAELRAVRVERQRAEAVVQLERLRTREASSGFNAVRFAGETSMKVLELAEYTPPEVLAVMRAYKTDTQNVQLVNTTMCEIPASKLGEIKDWSDLVIK